MHARHQAQFSIDGTAHESTTSSSSSETSSQFEELPPPETLMSPVRNWLRANTPDRLYLHDTNCQEFERVLTEIRHAGIKPRFDWDGETGTAIMRIPNTFSEVPKMWFSGEAMGALNDQLAQVAMCGRPSLTASGSVGVGVGPSAGQSGDLECVVTPDQSLYLEQIDANGQPIGVQEAPHIVLETSVNGSREHIMEKAFKYLYETGLAVRAVVICVMTNMPRTIFPNGSNDKPSKAEIAVWVRKETYNVELDYPLDECYHQEGFGDHKLGRDLNDELESTSDSSSESDDDPTTNASPVLGPDFDPGAREYYRVNPMNLEETQYIYRRSPEWIVFYDDADPVIQGSPMQLTLDVYDILRPCSKFPNNYIEDRQISIPLEALRQELSLRLKTIRNPPEPAPASMPGRIHPHKKSRRTQGSPEMECHLGEH